MERNMVKVAVRGTKMFRSEKPKVEEGDSDVESVDSNTQNYMRYVENKQINY